MIPKCPKCGNKKLIKSRKGNHLQCSNDYCNYQSEMMTKEKVEEILNYKPTLIDLLMEKIDENSEYILNDDYSGNYIKVKTIKELINKYFSDIKEKEENDGDS